MTVITLTGHLGSMGTIASLVAERLGYTLADRELLLEAAQALGWSEDDAQAFDERTGSHGLAGLLEDVMRQAAIAGMDSSGFGELVGSSYQDTAAPEMRPRDRQYIEVISALINGLAQRGDTIIVGRGAQALLAGHEGVVHVRVVCELGERVGRIARRDGTSLEATRTRVEDSDKQREAWHQKYFKIDYRSPYLYHLVVNSGWLSDELAADLIVELARTREPRGEGSTARG